MFLYFMKSVEIILDVFKSVASVMFRFGWFIFTSDLRKTPNKVILLICTTGLSDFKYHQQC